MLAPGRPERKPVHTQWWNWSADTDARFAAGTSHTANRRHPRGQRSWPVWFTAKSNMNIDTIPTPRYWSVAHTVLQNSGTDATARPVANVYSATTSIRRNRSIPPGAELRRHMRAAPRSAIAVAENSTPAAEVRNPVCGRVLSTRGGLHEPEAPIRTGAGTAHLASPRASSRISL
jgi:hypothetical protein